MCSNQNFLLQNMRSHELASLITIRVACLLIGELTCYYTNQMCNCGAAMDVKNRKHEWPKNSPKYEFMKEMKLCKNDWFYNSTEILTIDIMSIFKSLGIAYIFLYINGKGG